VNVMCVIGVTTSNPRLYSTGGRVRALERGAPGNVVFVRAGLDASLMSISSLLVAPVKLLKHVHRPYSNHSCIVNRPWSNSPFALARPQGVATRDTVAPPQLSRSEFDSTLVSQYGRADESTKTKVPKQEHTIKKTLQLRKSQAYPLLRSYTLYYSQRHTYGQIRSLLAPTLLSDYIYPTDGSL